MIFQVLFVSMICYYFDHFRHMCLLPLRYRDGILMFRYCTSLAFLGAARSRSIHRLATSMSGFLSVRFYCSRTEVYLLSYLCTHHTLTLELEPLSSSILDDHPRSFTSRLTLGNRWRW